ncbi:MAG: hypothetical protein HUU55_11270 [Myxococcales bacterium]|nr:hypothetical protein [Myxococcales bacterium]
MASQYRSGSRVPVPLVVLAIIGVVALVLALVLRSAPPVSSTTQVRGKIFSKVAVDLAAPVQIASSTLDQDVKMIADDLVQRPRQPATSKSLLLFLDSSAADAASREGSE